MREIFLLHARDFPIVYAMIFFTVGVSASSFDTCYWLLVYAKYDTCYWLLVTALFCHTVRYTVYTAISISQPNKKGYSKIYYITALVFLLRRSAN